MTTQLIPLLSISDHSFMFFIMTLVVTGSTVVIYIQECKELRIMIDTVREHGKLSAYKPKLEDQYVGISDYGWAFRSVDSLLNDPEVHPQIKKQAKRVASFRKGYSIAIFFIILLGMVYVGSD